MLQKILGILALIFVGTISLFVYCACIVSSIISEKERNKKE